MDQVLVLNLMTLVMDQVDVRGVICTNMTSFSSVIRMKKHPRNSS